MFEVLTSFLASDPFVPACVFFLSVRRIVCADFMQARELHVLCDERIVSMEYCLHMVKVALTTTRNNIL